jgi:hypothetical protein
MWEGAGKTEQVFGLWTNLGKPGKIWTNLGKQGQI